MDYSFQYDFILSLAKSIKFFMPRDVSADKDFQKMMSSVKVQNELKFQWGIDSNFRL